MAIVLGTNSGFVKIRPTTNPSGTSFIADNFATYFKCTTPYGTIKVTEIGVYIATAWEDTTLEIGIYTSDGNPDSLINKEVYDLTSSGWKIAPMELTLSSNTDYWLAFQIDNTGNATRADKTGLSGGVLKQNTATTLLERPSNPNINHSNTICAIYALYTAHPVIKGIRTIQGVSTIEM